VNSLVAALYKGEPIEKETRGQKATLQLLDKYRRAWPGGTACRDYSTASEADLMVLMAHVVKALEELQPQGKRYAVLPMGNFRQRPMALSKMEPLLHRMEQWLQVDETNDLIHLGRLKNALEQQRSVIQQAIKIEQEVKAAKRRAREAKRRARETRAKIDEADEEEEDDDDDEDDEDDDDDTDRGVNSRLLHFLVEKVLAAR